MASFVPIFKREFFSYFRSPVAYVFIIIFLLASVGCTFFIGNLYESNQANLTPFFMFLPWLYLVLVPAVGMRLWAEERRSGTIELLFTMPVTIQEAVLAKFTAGWAFLGIALLMTFPLVMTINYLGTPDNGVILAGYIASFLMAGAYLSIACLTSALTKNQVISFIIGVVASFFLILVGWGLFTDILSTFLPTVVVDMIASLGFMTHFMPIVRGVIDMRDVVYFLLIIGGALFFNGVILENRKAA